jgi:hypothetical protein
MSVSATTTERGGVTRRRVQSYFVDEDAGAAWDHWRVIEVESVVDLGFRGEASVMGQVKKAGSGSTDFRFMSSFHLGRRHSHDSLGWIFKARDTSKPFAMSTDRSVCTEPTCAV